MKKLILSILLLMMPLTSYGLNVQEVGENLTSNNPARESIAKFYISTIVDSVHVLDVLNMMSGNIRTICVAQKPEYLSDEELFSISKKVWNSMLDSAQLGTTLEQQEQFKEVYAPFAIIQYMKELFPCGKKL